MESLCAQERVLNLRVGILTLNYSAANSDMKCFMFTALWHVFAFYCNIIARLSDSDHFVLAHVPVLITAPGTHYSSYLGKIHDQ